MTVDVEEHFQVTAFARTIDRRSWNELPSRVVDNTIRLLDLFDEVGVKATFFILGLVAERHPALLRRIAEAGHELASHGQSHKTTFAMLAADWAPDRGWWRRLSRALGR